jgi:segregation and condensation protein B
MPDEEALSEEDMLIDELGNIEDVEAFVTDFMGEDTATAPPAEDVSEDEEDEGGLSVFAYTRDAPPAEDPEAFDQDSVKAAVLKLRRETRMPQQPMHTWRDDE